MQQQNTETLCSGKSDHRRQASLGKALPVMNLLLNSSPLSMASMHLRCVSDGRPTRYSNAEDSEIEPGATSDEAVAVTDEAGDELDLEVLVSDCSSDDSDSEGREKFAIAGKSDSYTPCLSCTGDATNELSMRPIAINDMCRKLCTEDCRLRLSLAGYEPPSEAALRSTEALSALVQGSSHSKHIFLTAQKDPSTKAATIVKDQTTPSKIDIQRKKFLTAQLQEPCYDKNMSVTPSVDSRENNVLKDFREKVEIAEALARTSAMTSTSQIKQRLAARKLEIEMDEANLQGVPAVASAAADACRDKIADDLATQNGSDYEPPRELLLYLVRMGSFNSAPKIHNTDTQDDGMVIPKGLNNTELLQHVKHLRGDNQPPLLTRYFLKPLDAPIVTADITDGLRFLKLNLVPKVRELSPNRIRLLQWNILSQTLGQNNDGFVCCPDEALTWENRKFLIVQEILQTDPDIICLQEVDHFKFLQNILGTQDYDGIFFPKPDSPCLYIEENNGPDGCAIFYKRNKFELKKFDTRILEVWRVQSNQVAIAANFQLKTTGEELCVCTTHLKARHGSLLSKLRNEQGRDLIRFVKKFAEERPVLLCGDFNAEPVEPVYSTMLSCDFLSLSSAYADLKELADKGNGNAEQSATEECDKVATSIKREPAYTTWKIREDGEECHTIDYVFYTKDRLQVKNCLDFPLGDEIGKNRTPSYQYPSDHFSLVCDFEFVQ